MSWTLWCTIPAFGCPSGTCIFNMNSTSQRASSSRSGILFLCSGMFIFPSLNSASVPRATARSYSFISVQAAIPPLTTYFP